MLNPINEERLKQSRILIVDDEPVNVQLLEAMLYSVGYSNVNSTSDSRKVRDLHQATQFDLILLDIRMPHLDGFQVMDQLNEISCNDYLPILVLTAHDDMETRLQALELGARDFLPKPFNSAEMLNRINNMLEVRALYNDKKHQAKYLEEMVQERTKELELRNQELEQTRYETVRCLGRASEYRDNETGNHIIRMSKSCQLLAIATGLSADKADAIMSASSMHDIGKIGIPDHILLKPGKLDAQEWEIMQSHVNIGGEILGEHNSNLMALARSIALTHHEKWDGSGYPDALVGENIPIEGRIAAICDVFDALTSDRPYKKGWPIDEAVSYINENAGLHFDPHLVTLFSEILPSILKMRQSYLDS